MGRQLGQRAGSIVIQPDCRLADPPPPPELLTTYGVKAQMLGPIRRNGLVAGWLSVHYSVSARAWSERDEASLQRAIDAVDATLAPLPAPGLVELANGARLYAFEHGAGRPIVFIHGWGTNSTIWRYQLAALAGKHHVIAIDCSGCGQSPPTGSPSAAALAVDLQGFFEQRGLEEALLVGWSTGGLVGLSYLEQFGAARLRGVAFVEVSPRLRPAVEWPGAWWLGEEDECSAAGQRDLRARWAEDRPAVLQEWFSAAFHRPDTQREQLAWLVDEAMKDTGDSIALLCDFRSLDFRVGLREVEVPVLLAYGTHSALIPVHVPRMMADVLPDARLVMFRGSGHAVMLEETGKLNRALQRFALSRE
jgi:pimeloyl-ACP methyl ester carboxylesterase